MKTPQEKAKQLMDKYRELDVGFWSTNLAKQCALLCINEILETIPLINNTIKESQKRLYFIETAHEIRKL